MPRGSSSSSASTAVTSYIPKGLPSTKGESTRTVRRTTLKPKQKVTPSAYRYRCNPINMGRPAAERNPLLDSFDECQLVTVDTVTPVLQQEQFQTEYVANTRQVNVDSATGAVQPVVDLYGLSTPVQDKNAPSFEYNEKPPMKPTVLGGGGTSSGGDLSGGGLEESKKGGKGAAICGHPLRLDHNGKVLNVCMHPVRVAGSQCDHHAVLYAGGGSTNNDEDGANNDRSTSALFQPVNDPAFMAAFPDSDSSYYPRAGGNHPHENCAGGNHPHENCAGGNHSYENRAGGKHEPHEDQASRMALRKQSRLTAEELRAQAMPLHAAENLHKLTDAERAALEEYDQSRPEDEKKVFYIYNGVFGDPSALDAKQSFGFSFSEKYIPGEFTTLAFATPDEAIRLKQLAGYRHRLQETFKGLRSLYRSMVGRVVPDDLTWSVADLESHIAAIVAVLENGRYVTSKRVAEFQPVNWVRKDYTKQSMGLFDGYDEWVDAVDVHGHPLMDPVIHYYATAPKVSKGEKWKPSQKLLRYQIVTNNGVEVLVKYNALLESVRQVFTQDLDILTPFFMNIVGVNEARNLTLLADALYRNHLNFNTSTQLQNPNKSVADEFRSFTRLPKLINPELLRYMDEMQMDLSVGMFVRAKAFALERAKKMQLPLPEHAASTDLEDETALALLENNDADQDAEDEQSQNIGDPTIQDGTPADAEFGNGGSSEEQVTTAGGGDGDGSQLADQKSVVAVAPVPLPVPTKKSKAAPKKRASGAGVRRGGAGSIRPKNKKKVGYEEPTRVGGCACANKNKKEADSDDVDDIEL